MTSRRYTVAFDPADLDLEGVMSMAAFKRASDGTTITSPAAPTTFIEIGFGVYTFGYDVDAVSLSDLPADDYIIAIVTATGAVSDHKVVTISRDDGRLARLHALEEGRWKIHTTGGDQNRLVLYDRDGSTVLQKWDLKDSAGSATTVNIMERVPVNTVP